MNSLMAGIVVFGLTALIVGAGAWVWWMEEK